MLHDSYPVGYRTGLKPIKHCDLACVLFICKQEVHYDFEEPVDEKNAEE